MFELSFQFVLESAVSELSEWIYQDYDQDWLRTSATLQQFVRKQCTSGQILLERYPSYLKDTFKTKFIQIQINVQVPNTEFRILEFRI